MSARRLLFVLSCVFVAAMPESPARALEPLVATGREIGIIDGDTIEIHGHVLDLYGIDAPELGQVCFHNGTPWQCGLEAAFALRKIVTVERDKIICKPWPATGPVASVICEAGPLDLAHAMISSGHVLVRHNAFPEYLEFERTAKIAGVGLWRGRFVVPGEWRRGRRLPDEEAMRSDLAACPIKAGIDSAGRKVYWVPTDHGFRAIHVAPERGERCFPSDEAARAAGWKRRVEYSDAEPTSQ